MVISESKGIRDLYAFTKIDLNYIDVYAVINGVEYKLRPKSDQRMRQSEFDAIYYYETKVVLNGVEVDEWDDGYYPVNLILLHFIGTRPGYVILSDDLLIRGISSDEIRHVVGGHPRDFGQVYVNLVPRKYYDKVILYRHYLDSSLDLSTIMESVYRARTGQMDKIELDLDSPNPDVLQKMIQLGVCREIDPTYQVSPRYETREI